MKIDGLPELLTILIAGIIIVAGTFIFGSTINFSVKVGLVVVLGGIGCFIIWFRLGTMK